jgi:hypothetical protein
MISTALCLHYHQVHSQIGCEVWVLYESRSIFFLLSFGCVSQLMQLEKYCRLYDVGKC